MLYIFVVHIPIAGLSLVPILLGWPLVLLPIHVVFLELIIDPACTVVFEADEQERGVMERPPRSLAEPIFGRRGLLVGLVQGLGELAAELVLLAWALPAVGEKGARAAVFTTMVLCNLGLIFVCRAGGRSLLATFRSPNRPEAIVTCGALILVGVALLVPPVTELFAFEAIQFRVIGLSIVAAVGSLAIASVARWWSPR
jgi:Ca2+-transporting ATPase